AAPRPLAAKPSPAVPDGLPIAGFVRHFFSYRLVGHGQTGQTVGYDASHDGAIDTQQETERVDSHRHVWTAARFLRAVARYTDTDIFVTQSELRQYLASFDRNANGRIDVTGGEFSRLYRAIWHRHPPRRASYTSFERRFYGG